MVLLLDMAVVQDSSEAREPEPEPEEVCLVEEEVPLGIPAVC